MNPYRREAIVVMMAGRSIHLLALNAESPAADVAWLDDSQRLARRLSLN